jgi:hypothetical protein
MSTAILKALDQEIRGLKSQLTALESARAALGGGARHGAASRRPKAGRRRKFSAAQRKEISRRMKAHWAKRRAAKK